MTILEALKNSVFYPVDSNRIEAIAIKRRINIDEVFSYSKSLTADYKLAEADVKMLVATSPNVSEGGMSISQEERETLIAMANTVYSELGDNQSMSAPTIQHLEDW